MRALEAVRTRTPGGSILPTGYQQRRDDAGLARSEGDHAWLSPRADLLVLTGLTLLVAALVGGVVVVP